LVGGVGKQEKMKADIESQIARIDQNLKLLIFSERYRQEMKARNNFLNICLDCPYKQLSEIEQKSMVKFVYGE